MKKISLIISAILLAVLVAVCCCSCGGDAPEEHLHSFSVKGTSLEFLASEGDCNKGATYYYSCPCGAKGTETFQLDQPQHGEMTWRYESQNSLNHSAKLVCNTCNQTTSEVLELHNYAGASCVKCSSKKGTNEFNPGLYQSGTDIIVMTWEELKSNGIIDTSGVIINGKQSELAGDLIMPASVLAVPADAFKACTGLTRVCLSNSTSSIGDSAFADCSGLVSVTLPTSLKSIGNSAFSGCASLIAVNVPDTVTAVGGGAFANCTGIVDIKLSSKITEIKDTTLMGLHNVREITIPASVEKINKHAFLDCFNLGKINYEGTKEQWDTIVKAEAWFGYVNAVSVVCSDGTVVNYYGVVK